jgi:Protein of unknown function (DUF982)
MAMRRFDSPFFVKAGNSIVEEIACLEEALEFLYDWPEGRRGVIYHTALRACQSVIERDFPLSAAREAFVGFAKSAGILEKVDTLLPWTIPLPKAGGATT